MSEFEKKLDSIASGFLWGRDKPFEDEDMKAHGLTVGRWSREDTLREVCEWLRSDEARGFEHRFMVWRREPMFPSAKDYADEIERQFLKESDK